VCQEYGVDVYRYFLLRAMAFGADGDFSERSLRQCYNTDLANGVGNLLSRTVKMIEKYFDSVLPPPSDLAGHDSDVRSAAEDLHASATDLMERCRFETYLDKIQTLAAATNKFIEKTTPFKLAADTTPQAQARLGGILYTCAEAVRIVLLYLQPIMPDKALAGLRQLWPQSGGETLGEAGGWGVLQRGAAVAKGDALFPRKK
ncbi:MAG: class I tRNA ligase family protein, partial [Planctomycetes bacterium]|nr:class I tRNA ligase family protein [Planctomycetota bacterium]